MGGCYTRCYTTLGATRCKPFWKIYIAAANAVPTTCGAAFPRRCVMPTPPGKLEISCSLRTSDYTLAKQRLHAQMTAIDAQFERQQIKLGQRWNAADRPSQHVTHLSDEQVKDLADNYVHCVLESDEAGRRAGLDDCEFEALGSRIAEQRRELGNLLARGRSERIVPAMQSFFHLCQINAQLSPEDERRASYVFLQAVVKA